MPCNLRVTTTLKVEKMSTPVLKAALEGMGCKVDQVGEMLSFWGPVEGTYCAGNLTVRTAAGQAQDAAQRVKVGYTREAVAFAARRQGFKVEARGENQLNIRTGGVA